MKDSFNSITLLWFWVIITLAPELLAGRHEIADEYSLSLHRKFLPFPDG
jgi:hypothetical protein